MTSLQISNSLTRTKDLFKPINLKKVSMYVCGPTVYANPHVGNGRSLIVFDLLFRVLIKLYGRENVTYVRNITVNTSLFSDWFTFLIAIFFSQFAYLSLISNFSEITLNYTDVFYSAFFTFLFYPLFWFIFNVFKSKILGVRDE